MVLDELALPGTHNKVVELMRKHHGSARTILDLGAGRGALAQKLYDAGLDVLATDVQEYCAASVPFVRLDLNERQFCQAFAKTFDVITAVEVIEHVENPIAFLTNIRHLLAEDGLAIVTTPNIENIPGRIKFFISGKLRSMDDLAPYHISPILYDLFIRQYIKLAHLRLVDHAVLPADGFILTSRPYLSPILRVVKHLFRGPALMGDTQIFVLRPC